ncbi:MAG TPA: tRNA (uridine(34)/cytosine(34)/5-carboxymethylaminomethyluridine(34)-2'-O)-methyltransferase TrmL [Candidatus Atopostipes pullistercoris]|uniref:Putative tRNA (cytidine(34)-2'-O)-methyltransferase n=1 Tax=Candidatus Atopostipes pullistercoris TaxID=2838467 RepID=A0A9D2JX84_9LACT|nr:tRNA (uridine(34)/cytosine(34)/5-carboxymethylaminomethyluridine(34)-2'-O)-methyltransferase TrmL [Candidatus Atopostipes pullistercoris]
MNHIVLYKPQIPPNTGNIVRTCAGTDAHLHLIFPLGFSLEDRMLKRAGLDYWNELKITSHKSLKSFLEYAKDGQLHLVTKFAHQTYTDVDYSNTDEDHYFIFGKETTGLPEKFMRENEENCIRIPMDDTHIRSLNLSNTVSIIIYEALRQQNFQHMDLTKHYEKDKLD